MLSRTWVCEEWKEMGEKGWRPIWMRDADPYFGMAVAHDILEHPSRCVTGPVEDEFMAIGAMYLIRGENDWWARTGNICPVHEHMSCDIPDIMRRVREGRQSFGPPPVWRRGLLRGPMDFFHHLLEHTQTRLAIDSVERYDEEDYLVMTPQERHWFIGWVYRGYMMARRRYAHVDSYSLSYLFTNIMEDADKKLKHAELGDVLQVSVNLKRLKFVSSIREVLYD